jgi:prephenate dehydrogenase
MMTHLRHCDRASLVIDTCSVKVEAEKRLRAALPDHQNLLITHPMFGPQSAANGVAGHTLIVTGAYGDRAEAAVTYCQEKLGLAVRRMTSDEHDRIMADVHALTFFVARGLARYGLKESPFQAPSFKMLLDLVAFDASHTDELFRTIEMGSPYARSAREKFIRTLESINRQLEKEKL